MAEKNKIREWLLIVAGTALMAVAINGIFEPANMVIGGFSGLAIVAKYFSGLILGRELPLWLLMGALNVPLFAAGIWLKGWKYVARSVVATFLLSFFLGVIPEGLFDTGDMILTSIFGGLICGAGIGLVFCGGATTGGTDMAAAMLKPLAGNYSVMQIMMALDGMIVLLGVWAFGLNVALYALIAVFTLTKVSDGLIEGLNDSTVAFIISENSSQIGAYILKHMERGVTKLQAVGGYSGKRKDMLFCVTGRREVMRLKKLTAEADPDAFVIVCDAREVLGEGFAKFK